jgi:putative tryptophan/tyrosine transport system substrate-binding protein
VKRREFITLFGGAAVAWPVAASAQQAGKLPIIGFLGASTSSNWSTWTGAFVQRLRELGWIEGRTVAIEYRWAEGRTERYAEIAAEFVQLKVDMIVTSGTAIHAVKDATEVIPVVFTVAADPVGSGVVASLARPGGNITGVVLQQTDTVGKRLELIREVIPDLHRLAIMVNVGFPDAERELGEIQSAPGLLGIDVTRAFERLKGRADALYVVGDALTATNRVRINTFALSTRPPTMLSLREAVEAGGLISYGPNFPNLWRRAADYVDKILRGAKPADIPVEQPAKFDLVINLITAKCSASKCLRRCSPAPTR